MKKAVIFDMDGVISDTQKFHAEAESKILSIFHIDMSPQEITQKYAGVSDEKMFDELFKQNNIYNYQMKEILAKKWNLMKEVAEGKVTAMPGAVELIQACKKNGLKLAVASASTPRFINYVIETLSIKSFFDTLVSSQEVCRGKPAPDIFLLAAKRLCVNPRDCVVIEDGRSGMVGARKAGMVCIGLISDNEKKWPANILVSSLNQLKIHTILYPKIRTT
jgi:beta-phosphoglucomutase family hydrolase